ncbi:unnamed protein product [Angiostrongylus costaricensis]|uniref:PAN domain protein n=1 Tax=Angiostrongylus costaricensis TaxID=334426 RepID=A0A0R3PMU4_ANGCS|nr:unnamed protein product [Angiostrongylus costaricensis]
MRVVPGRWWILVLLDFLMETPNSFSSWKTLPGINSPNATTYLRSDGIRLMEFPTHSISNVTLNACAKACTDDANVSTDHMCSSFEYDARSRECSVHADDGQPFGQSVLAKTNKSVAYFQKMCVIGEALCSSPYAFERFPQSILIGHAMKVLNVTGLSECLSQCLATTSSLNTECRSVMYFYEYGECIINRERRVDRPDLFVEDVRNQLVDYFENNCHDVQCLSGELHWVRTDEYFVSHEKDVVIESECHRSFQANFIGSEKFPCKAFVYSAARQECTYEKAENYADILCTVVEQKQCVTPNFIDGKTDVSTDFSFVRASNGQVDCILRHTPPYSKREVTKRRFQPH